MFRFIFAICSVSIIANVQCSPQGGRILEEEKSDFAAKISNSHPMDQKKFDEILIGYIDREDGTFSLEKLKEEGKIVKPTVALQKILNGKGFTKTGVFDLIDFELRSQTTVLYNFLSAAPDWETLKKMVSFMKDKVHLDMLKYALATAVYHQPKKFKMAPPNWFEVFPNYILPASTLRDLYRRKMKGVKDTIVYVNIANETVVGKNKYFNAFSETDPEAKLRYFRDDTSLSNMFLNWHLHFPNWRTVGKNGNSEKWEDRGHLFYYFHQQLLSRYNLERMYNKLEPVDGLSWSNVEMGRYVLDLLDNDGDPIPGRHAGHPNTQNTWWKRMEDVQTRQKRIGEAVDSNLVLNIEHQKLEPFYAGSEMYQLGNMILGTDNSSHPEYYGSYFFDATDAVNIMGKGDIADNKEPGFFFKMLTTLRDPIFFQLLENICTYFRSYASTYLEDYKEVDEMHNFHGLALDSVQVGHLSTYFDYEEIDVTKAIDLAPRETTDDIKYRAKILKLNHKPFAYDVTISLNSSYEGLANGEKTTKVMFRLFLGPDNDWRGQKMDFELAKHYFVEIDRFPIELEVGTNIVSRNSKDSSIYVDGELNYARVDDLIRLGRKTKKEWDLSFLKEICHCGMPNNLMLPKGDVSGAKFRMIAMITPFTPKPQKEGIREFKSFPMCGQPRYMDHWTGFPFDRIWSIRDDYFRSPFAINQVVTIYHHNHNTSS
ncbi:Larval serum protein 2 [Nesidiocoris tenuis]|uniref:Larval serum protein 2 n=1 Tax=Nesidiocoris tenuis TaxID=355587 RepID=A0ABN7AIM5_9HEMI|nr:Larval serum protein 2 [Nesidiocoris tenuis]